MIPKITLEQWAAFKAVVDEGSFARAAETLNKSQSTVSYSLSKMEERLPAPVFEQAGRKAQLTDFGEAIYRHASNLLEQAQLLDQTANYLASGWEAEVTLAVDGIVCINKVFKALQNFSKESPQTRIRILEPTLSGTDEALIQREADLVITARVPPGFLAEPFGFVKKVPVSSPDHSLQKQTFPITEDILKQHRQIVIRDSGIKRSQNSGWLDSEQRWTVSHFATSIAAVKAGLGFGFLPKEQILRELENGELVLVPLEQGREQLIPIYIVDSAQSHAGPATLEIKRYLAQQKLGE